MDHYSTNDFSVCICKYVDVYINETLNAEIYYWALPDQEEIFSNMYNITSVNRDRAEQMPVAI